MRSYLSRSWLVAPMALVMGLMLGAATVSRGAAGRADGAALQFLAEHLTVVEGPLNGLAGPHLIFEGVNVHVRSGTGRTDDGTLNDEGALTGLRPTGLGNFVVGYNEEPDTPLGPDERGGSHNLIVGRSHRFPNVGGLVAGVRNTVSGLFASASGGSGNIASGTQASVSGGSGNTASGIQTSISGGSGNTANEIRASVTGGGGNIASGLWASVTGGHGNIASGTYATVSGGVNRSAAGDGNWAAGGQFEIN